MKSQFQWRENETPEGRETKMKYPQNYKCTTRAGVLKRIAGLLILRATYVAMEYRPEQIQKLDNDIRRYKRQLEDLPLKRKKITL